MIRKLQAWWHRPITPKDRVFAVMVGGAGGFWVGILGRLLFGPMPVSLSTLGWWALGSIGVGIVLGIMFPKATTVVLFPFATIGVGGSA